MKELNTFATIAVGGKFAILVRTLSRARAEIGSTSTLRLHRDQIQTVPLSDFVPRFKMLYEDWGLEP
jgi:hypothetical protein